MLPYPIRSALLTLALPAIVGALPPTLGAQTPDPAKAITQLRLDSWTDEDGLPGNSVQSIVQAADGYLWLGTEQGAARFDGAQFTVFEPRNTPALRASFVRALGARADGTVWMGVQGGGLVRVRGPRFTRIDRANGLSSDQVLALAPAHDGGVWVGTGGGGLSHVSADGRIVRPYSRTHGLAHDFVNAVLEDVDRTVWIGTPVGLARLRDGAIVNVPLPGGATRGVTALVRTRSGEIIVGTTNGLAAIRDGRLHPLPHARELQGVHVRCLLEDSRGTLWVGTHGSGLLRVVGDRVSSLTAKDGLGADLIRALYEDREGAIWIATNGGGLQRLRDTRATVFGKPEGLPSDVALAVMESRDGGMWIGSAGSGLAHLRDGAVHTITRKTDGLSHDVILSLAYDHHGALWVGTASGLNRLSDGRVTVYRERDGLSAGAILATFVDSRGALWIGTDGGGLQRWRPGAPTTYRKRDGLPSDAVTAIAEGRDGDLWIGTREGLARLHGDRIERAAAGLGAREILALHVDASGTLWIGMSDGGLARLRDGRVARVGSADGLVDDHVYSILEDDRGGFWLSGTQGISRLAKQELERYMDAKPRASRLHPRVFGIADGMRTREANGGVSPAAWRARDGRLWFPTLRGVVVLDPARIEEKRPAPPVHIERVVAGTRELPLADTVRIPTGEEELHFDFAALTFGSPEQVRYRYRLEGFDRTWVDGGSVRHARYTRIPPGTYTFRVVAADADGVWNEAGAALPVVRTPRIHEMPLLRLAAALAVITAVLSLASWLHRRRVRDLRARERELTDLVADRTRAEERYRELFENASDAVFTTDLAGRLTSVNRRFVDLTGYERAELLGRPIGMLLPGAEGAGGLPHPWREPTTAAEMEIVGRDGRRVPIEVSTRRMSEQGVPTGIHAIARDVTDRERMKQRLMRAQRMEALGQLAGGVAHDFNNVLLAITSYSEFLLEELSPDDPRRDDAVEIRKAADRAAALTRQLLAFSRQQVLQPRVLSLNDVVIDLQPMLRRLLREDIDMRLALRPSLGAVAADPGQLEQVLLNLVVNARDAMPEGGTLTIETSEMAIEEPLEGSDDGGALAAGRYATLSVSDSGEGMRQEVLARIFEPFFTTKALGKGTGLGLATVHGIVEQSGGRIACSSEPGRGTTFRIWLPQVEAEPRARHDPAPDGLERGTESVLVVEDDAAVRSTVCRVLERCGYRVLEAVNGAEALVRCADPQLHVDLVVSDMIMPEMNGHELAIRLRVLRPEVRVLLMSGYSKDAVTRPEMLREADAFLEKPFAPETLASTVRAVLDGVVATSHPAVL